MLAVAARAAPVLRITGVAADAASTLLREIFMSSSPTLLLSALIQSFAHGSMGSILSDNLSVLQPWSASEAACGRDLRMANANQAMSGRWYSWVGLNHR